MRRSFVKSFLLMAVIGLFAVMVTGCGSSADSGQDDGEKSDSQTVSVALWGAQLLETYAPWLQEQYPDVDFDFYIVKNSTEYYSWSAENGTIPDILTVRRFALRDVEGMKGQLLDLNDTELAQTFYQSYLNNYTYSDGTVNWLPACAEIDDIAVNKTLFEENNIPIPTDWESFVYACEEFEKLGIQGFAADFSKDYTCMMALQGFAAAELMTSDGRQWRQEYESGETDQINEEIWRPAFERFFELLQDGIITDEMLEMNENDMITAFGEGKIAMVRATGASFSDSGDDYEFAMLPYFGDTEDDNRYLTYPAFQIAANASCSEDPEREEQIQDIMTTMLSEEGLNQISTGKSMIAYNKNVNLELMDELSDMQPYIEENKIYVRLASSDMFSVSQSVVTKMITGELTDADDALAAFNTELADDGVAEEPVVMHLDRSYSHEFTNGSGNEAASAVYNTVREELGVDCVIGQSAIVGADIPEGDYTEKEKAYVTVGWDGGSLLKMELTGSELKSVVQYFLDAEGTRDTVINNSTLPVTSGMEMELAQTDDGYTVEKLTADGEEVSDDQTYTTVVRITYGFNVSDFEAAGYTDYEKLDTTLNALLNKRLIEESAQLAEPSDYITVETAAQ